MKHKKLWIILGVLALACILVLAALNFRNGDGESKAKETEQAAEPTPEPTPVDPELPLDDTPLTPVSPDEEDETADQTDGGDSATGDTTNEQDAPADEGSSDEPIEDGLDEDELPIMP